MKQKYVGMSFLLVIIIFGVLVFSTWAFAISLADRPATAASGDTGDIQAQKMAEQISPLTYGTTDTIILQIPDAAFVPVFGSDFVMNSGDGYVHTTVGGVVCAPVNLPNGAQIRWLDLYYSDTDVSLDASAILYQFMGTSSPSWQNIATVSSSGSAGYGYSASMLNPMVTVDNNNQYMVFVYLTGGTSLRFKGVNIWYRLQISPAPGTATFTDVPVGAQFFQEIEALADSGITTGYGDGTFRPNNPVTRGQMAAFLARALGLHWPY